MKNFTLSPFHSRVSQKTLTGLILSKAFRFAFLLFIFNFCLAGFSYSQSPCETGGTVSNDTTICNNTAANLSIIGSSGDVFQWQYSSEPTTGFLNVSSGGTSNAYTTDALTDTTYFRVVVGVNAGGCDADTSAIIQVAVVGEPVAGSVSVDTSICDNTTATVRITGSTGGGTLTYQWQSSLLPASGFSNVSGGSGDATENYTTGNLSDTTYFRVVVGNGICDADTSAVIRVAVVDVPVPGTVSADTTICKFNVATVRITGSSGGGTLTYQWQSSLLPSSGFGNVSGGSGGATENYTTGSLTDTTYFRVVVGNGICDADTSAVIRVAVEDLPSAGTVSADTSICTGTTATVRITGSTGGGSLTYQWESSTLPTSGFSNVSGGSGDATENYTTDILSDTTYFRVVVGNGNCSDTSAVIRVAVVAGPVAGTVSPDTVICITSPTATVRITGSTGGGTLTYQWQSSADPLTGFTDVTGGSGGTSAIYTTASLTDTTYFRVVVGNGICDADTSGVIEVAVKTCTEFTELTTSINSPHSGVFSDTVWVRARLVELVSGLPVQGDTVEFRIYNGSDPSIPSADVNIPPAITDANGFARSYITLTQDPDWSDTFDDRNGDTMHIRAYFAGDESYGSAERVENFNVRKEVAEFVSFDKDVTCTDCLSVPDAKKIKFNGKVGAGYVVTPNSTVDVTITVKIKDETDELPGDITKANVRFELNPSGSSTPIVEFGRPSVLDSTVSVTFENLSTGSYGSNSFTVHVTVGDYYRGRLNSTLTVHKKGVASLFSGGGDILLSSSTGKYAGDPGTLSSFTLGSRFNKTASKVQGKASLIFTSKGRTYEVTGSGTPTVTFDSVGGVASYVSAASIADITFDSTGSGTLSTFASPSNLTLSYNMKDSTTDYVSVKVADGSTVWFTNQGNGSSTDRQALLNGGMTIAASIAAPVGTSATRCGAGTLTLGATPPSGATVDWYTDSTGGTLVKSGSTSYTTSVISQTTKFYAESRNTITSARSATRTAVTATVNAAPDAPVASGGSRCGTGSVPLSATAPANGSVAWYSAATGGSALSTSTTFNTPSISATTYYYVEAKLTATGCASPTRTKVTATVNAAPAAPTALASTAICGISGSTTLSVSAAAGSSVEWYETSSSTLILATGNTFTTPTLTASKTYYAMARNTTCASSRTAVTATVSALPAAPSSISGTLKVCPVNGTNYSFTAAKVTGAAGYAWSIPACATSNGSTTNNISVKFGAAGGNKDTLFVQAKNTAGCFSVKKGVTVTSVTTCTSCYTGASANTQSRLSENEVYNPSAGLILKAFPNPNTGMFKLSVSGFGEGAALVRVMDLGGRLVYTTQPTLMRGTTWVPLNITQLPGGTYFVQVWQREKMSTVKISKE